MERHKISFEITGDNCSKIAFQSIPSGYATLMRVQNLDDLEGDL